MCLGPLFASPAVSAGLDYIYKKQGDGQPAIKQICYKGFDTESLAQDRHVRPSQAEQGSILPVKGNSFSGLLGAAHAAWVGGACLHALDSAAAAAAVTVYFRSVHTCVFLLLRDTCLFVT